MIVFNASIVGSQPGTIGCGGAFSQWIRDGVTPTFQAVNGLDRRGRHTRYVALVSSAGGCRNFDQIDTASHELGHILGGHHDNPGTQRTIRSDARAKTIAWTYFGVPVVSASTLVSGVDPACQQAASGRCTPENYYTTRDNPNNAILHLGDNAHENDLTIELTARSVANYWEPLPQSGGGGPGGGGGCNLTVPSNIRSTGFQCVGATGTITEHNVVWNDQCPSAAVLYQLLATPFASSGLSPFTFFRSNRQTFFYVNNTGGGLTVAGIGNVGQRTPYASPPVGLDDLCF